MATLTKASQNVLKAVYEAYLERVKGGQGKDSAARFADADTALFPGFADAKDELAKAGFIKPNILGDFALTNPAVAFMESQV